MRLEPRSRCTFPRDRDGAILRHDLRVKWGTWTDCHSSRLVEANATRSRNISSATCICPFIALYRPWLHLPPHLLPLAANRWGLVPHPQCRKRHRGDRLGKQGVPAGKRILLRRRRSTSDRPGEVAIARARHGAGRDLGHAKANVPRETLKIMRDNGLRLLLVGYESGNQQILNNIKKGLRIGHRAGVHQACRELRT